MELVRTILRNTLAVALPALMFAQGLRIARGQLGFPRRHPGVLLRSILAVDVLVPLATWAIVLAVRPAPNVAVGLAVLASASVAPFVIVRAPRAGGDPEYVASLHLTLAVLSIATTPLTLAFMSRALGFRAEISVLAVLKQVASIQVIPLVVGVLVRRWYPEPAEQISLPLTRAAGAVLILAVVVVLAVAAPRLLTRIDVRGYAAMALVLIAALLIGQLLAGRSRDRQVALALEAATRNPGVALLIATLNFTREGAIAVLIPYLVVQLVVSGAYLKLLNRRASRSAGNAGA